MFIIQLINEQRAHQLKQLQYLCSPQGAVKVLQQRPLLAWGSRVPQPLREPSPALMIGQQVVSNVTI